MPHLWIEVSGSIEAEPEVAGLARAMHGVLAADPIFPLAGIRTRFSVVRDCIIADGDPAHGFVHLVLRIGAGRDEATRKAAADAIFEALCRHLAPLQARRTLGISFEMQEMHPVLNYKRNNIHEHLARKRAAAE